MGAEIIDFEIETFYYGLLDSHLAVKGFYPSMIQRLFYCLEAMMRWFKHDSDATQDAKVKKLIIRYGAIGYAIYFHCLELIAGDVSESNITFQLEHDSEIIADNLRIKGTHEQSGIQIVEEIVRFIVELKLFEQSGDKIFCFKLLKRMDSSMASDGFRKVIVKAKESHDRVMIESCPSHDVIMLEENRIEQTRSEENRIDNIAVNEVIPKKRKTKSTPFIPPTQDEAIAYCKEKKYIINPLYFIEYYTNLEWKKKDGNPVLNWKNTMMSWNDNALKRGEKPWIPPSPPKEGKHFNVANEYSSAADDARFDKEWAEKVALMEKNRKIEEDREARKKESASV